MVEERHLNNAELAQLGEHLPYKQRVGGSSPSFRTKIYRLVPIIHSRSKLPGRIMCGRDVAGLYIYHMLIGDRFFSVESETARKELTP